MSAASAISQAKEQRRYLAAWFPYLPADRILLSVPGLIPELIALAKSKPGELNYGSTGVGSGSHLSTELFMVRTGIKMTHVPYRGTAPALQDVLAGRVPLFMQTIVGGIGPYRNGQVRPLVAFGRERVPEIPDIPI